MIIDQATPAPASEKPPDSHTWLPPVPPVPVLDMTINDCFNRRSSFRKDVHAMMLSGAAIARCAKAAADITLRCGLYRKRR